MANTDNGPTVHHLFRLLDQWRHLPAYRLENRVDPFFALFLPEILKACSDIEIDQTVIPEFPLKKAQNMQSTKVDYFALSRGHDRVFLIELKTDMHSIDPGQINYLKCAANKELHQILCELKVLCTAERPLDGRRKYFHLLRILDGLGLIKLPPGLKKKLYGGNPKGVYECIKRIEVTVDHARPKTEIICILPDAKKAKTKFPRNFQCIGFKDVASCLKKQRGAISQVFAEYLERWTEQAGTSPDG